MKKLILLVMLMTMGISASTKEDILKFVKTYAGNIIDRKDDLIVAYFDYSKMLCKYEFENDTHVCTVSLELDKSYADYRKRVKDYTERFGEPTEANAEGMEGVSFLNESRYVFYDTKEKAIGEVLYIKEFNLELKKLKEESNLIEEEE